MFSNLRRFVTFSNVLIIGIPILVISLASFKAISISIEEEVKQKNYLLSQSVAGEISRFLQKSISVLLQVRHYLDDQTFLNIEQITNYLHKTRIDHGVFNSIEVLDHSGKVLIRSPADPDLIGLDYSRQDFFRRSLHTDSITWSNTFISLENGLPTLTLSIKTDNGIVVGYLDLATLNQIVGRIRLGKEGYTMVVDNSGTIIAHNNHRFVQERVNVKSLEIVKIGLKGKDGAYRYTNQGEDFLGSISQIDPTNWLVLVAQPVRDAFAPVDRTIRITLLVICIVLLLTVFISFFSLRRLFQSIKNLTDQTKKIARGDYHAELPAKSFSEINELIANFSQMARDIEKRENKLIQKENELQTLIETIPQGVFELNTVGQVIRVNPALLKILEVQADQLLYSYIWDYWVEERLKQMFRNIINSIENKRIAPKSLDGKAKTGTGRIIDIQLDWTYKLDSSGNAIGVVCVQSDITDKKKAAMALKKANDQLESKVKERTEELSIAMVEAQAANQAKSEFLANISHELRNPMHHILSYSKYGVEKFSEVAGEKLFHYFIQIRKSAERLMILLNDLLDLSKMESGKMEYSFTRKCIKTVIQESITEMVPSAGEKNQQILFEEPAFSTLVTMDSFKIGQVMRNLLSNAIRYTPENKTIAVKLTQSEIVESLQSSPSLKVSVKDQGVGIPQDELSLVFEKFTQSTYTKTGAGGTGLGLAICGEIIQAHQGRIWAENNSDVGATFYFMLKY